MGHWSAAQKDAQAHHVRGASVAHLVNQVTLAQCRAMRVPAVVVGGTFDGCTIARSAKGWRLTRASGEVVADASWPTVLDTCERIARTKKPADT